MSQLFNSFHIYNKNAPQWDYSKKTFEEQSNSVQMYYMFELLKMRRGVSFGNIKIHPWLYWHTNYWTLSQDTKEEGEHTIDATMALARLRDNEWIINDHLIRAEQERKGLVIMGTRRAAKSAFISSYTGFTATIRGGGEVRQCVVAGASSDDLLNVTSYINGGMKHMHPMFNLYPPTTTDFFGKKGVQFGHKTTSNVPNIYSTIKVNNLAKGDEAAAGATPMSFIMDEIGKFDCGHHFSVAKPSLATPYGWRTVPILVGTGGEIELAEPSKQLMYNPDINNMIGMNWDLLNKGVARPTWTTGIDCGLFIPGQCSLETPKVTTTLSKYLEVSDKYLDKIKIDVTDWDAALDHMDSELNKLKNKYPDKYIKQRSYYPKDVGDIFITTAHNSFPVGDINTILIDLTNKGKVNHGMSISLEASTNKLILKPTDAELAEYPFKGGTIDAPVQIFITPPKVPNFKNKEFVGGIDFYKQVQSLNTDSVGTIYILKRMTDIHDRQGYHIAASYAARPIEPETWFKNAYMLQIGYGAEALQEAADTGYEAWLRTVKRGELSKLLPDGGVVDETRPNKQLNKTSGKKIHRHGYTATQDHKNYCVGLVIQYANELVDIEDENGEIITTKGVYRIKDVGLLQEMLNFAPGKNVDRIIAFGHALAWAKHLDSIGAVATDSNREIKEEEEVKEPTQDDLQLARSITRNAIRNGRMTIGSTYRRR